MFKEMNTTALECEYSGGFCCSEHIYYFNYQSSVWLCVKYAWHTKFLKFLDNILFLFLKMLSLMCLKGHLLLFTWRF